MAGHAPEAAGETMTHDQLRLRLLRVEGRLAVLEADRRPPAARPRTTRKNSHYVDIGAEEHLVRVRLWSHWQLLRRAQAGGKTFNRRRGMSGPWTVEAFCADVRDAEGLRFNSREIWRWLSDANTHAPGSRQDVRITGAINAAIADLTASGVTLSPGT
jgi:hypothetical protein